MKPKKTFTLFKVVIFIIGFLFAFTATQAQTWTQTGNDIDGEAANDYSGRTISLNSDGSVVAIGAPENDGNADNAGHVRIYEKQSGVWTQIGDDIDGIGLGDQCGSSVSLSSDGSIVAVGAPWNDGNANNAGQVRVFENQSGSWTQIGNDIDGEAEEDLSGEAVSLNFDGSVLAIGAPENDENGSNAGHVRIYENQSGSWTQIGNDIDGEAADDHFGRAVSLSSDGSVVAIGAPYDDENGTNSGHVRIYENQSGTWTQIGDDIDGEAESDNFGAAVSLSSDGSVVAIGARYNDGNGDNSGHVLIYENQSGTWTQVGDDIDGEAVDDYSGEAVSLSSDGLVVTIGAKYNDGNGINSGHVRIYENQGGTWTQIGDDIDGEAEGDESGAAVSLSSDGSVAAIGAPRNDGNGTNAGHTRVYYNSEPCSNVITMNLSQEYTGTLGTAGVWQDYTDCDWTEPGEEQVYQFTTTDAGEYELIADEISGDPDFYLMTACDPNSTNVHGDCWNNGTITENLETSTTYYIIVDNYDDATEAEYSIQVNPPSPCEDIITMNLSQEYTGTLGTAGVWQDYTDCDWTEPGEEQVYQFTTTDAGEYELIADEISGDPDFYLMTACDPNSTNVHGDCWNNGTIIENLEASTTYYIIVDNYDDATEAEYSIQVSFATGLTEPDKQSFSVYPNPADSKINIQMSKNINKVFVKMENALGKQLIGKHIHSRTGEIDVSHLKPGIYFINLNTEKGKLVKKIIIK